MFLTCLVLVWLVSGQTRAVDPCETPNGQDGDCIPINQCPEIFSLFQTGFSSMTAKIIRKSQCGTIGMYPKVCCALGSMMPPTSPTSPTMKIMSRVLSDEPACGLSVQNKISGGNKTEIDEFPWMALLEYQYKGNFWFGCGGSLISRRYVLTARHCLRHSLVRVRLGEWDTRTDPDCIKSKYGFIPDCAPNVLKVPVERKIFYKGDGDIGLIRLSEEVEYNDFIKPICLPSPNDLSSYRRKHLIVSGWGLTEKKKLSEVKLKLQVSAKPLSLCEKGLKEVFKTEISLNENHICAGGKRGEDACNGDSGGPLMYKNSERFELVGVVSFGPNQPCGQENRPGVYVRVSKYVNWILDNIQS